MIEEGDQRRAAAGASTAMRSAGEPPASRADRGVIVAEAVDLTVEHVRRGAGGGQRFAAVDHVSLDVAAGEIVGIVGESGSGKTTVALALSGLGPRTSGVARVVGHDLGELRGAELRRLRADVQVVFQDPHGSLDPRQSARAGLRELRALQPERTSWISDEELFERVRLDPKLLDRYPHQLSGGQAQRLCIARALLLRPRLLVADEPTSGLDVAVQADVLRLLRELRDAHGVAILFISHDLSVVRSLCDRVYVMLRGQVVEHGPVAEVLNRPQHPYTRKLIAAVPGRRRAAQEAGRDVELPAPAVEKVAPRRGSRWLGTARFLARKLGLALITLAIALSIAFLLGRASGDPTVNILGPTATPEQVTALRAELGLDRSLLAQYLSFVADTVTLRFGDSLQYFRSNVDLITDRMLATFQLVVAGMLIATLVGVPLGIVAALREGTRWDRLASAFALIGQSIPVFWLGLMLVLVFAVNLGVLPAGQSGTLRHLILPAVTLSLLPMAQIARLTRASMAEVLREPYIVAARARGLARRVVIGRHALRNASPPIVTITALQVGALLSGAVAVEYVYSWPGLGLMSINAVMFKDYPLVQALVVFGAVAFVLINLLVDVLYGVIDPRIGDGQR